MKHLLHLLPAVLLAALGFVASCENEKTAGDGDAVLEVSPSYARLRRGASVTLTASGAKAFVWELEDPSIGSLSARHGKSVVYTAQVCQPEDVTQTVHVYSGVTSSTNGTTSARYAGSATILHIGTGEVSTP